MTEDPADDAELLAVLEEERYAAPVAPLARRTRIEGDGAEPGQTTVHL